MNSTSTGKESINQRHWMAKHIAPDKFYKGGSQEKTHLLRPEFSLLPSPLDRVRSVLNFRAMNSGAGHDDPAVWVFSISGFHRFLATKPVCSETSKQYGGWVATIVLSGTRGP
jgi:hypothetical protein